MENDKQLNEPGLAITESNQTSPNMPPNNHALAAAAERRMQQQREQHLDQPIDFDENHDKRQQFRRMIDPGILRRNAMPIAVEALQVQFTYLSRRSFRIMMMGL